MNTFRIFAFLGVSVAMTATASSARADVPANGEKPAASVDDGIWPRLGGHVGLSMPIMQFGRTTQVIGSDFVTLAPAVGLTLKLSPRWAFDLEGVISAPLKPGNGTETYTVDPGVIYDFGPFAVGGRVAFNIGQAENVGLIPLVHKGFKLNDRVAFFIEADLPGALLPGRSDGVTRGPRGLCVLSQAARERQKGWSAHRRSAAYAAR